MRSIIGPAFAGIAALLLSAPALAQEQAPARPKLPAAKPVAVVAPAVDPANVWILDLSTGGRVTIQLRPDVAPQTVERIKTLTRRRFYDGLQFHRVIDGFMAQGGDPKGDGTGGSDQPDVQAEFSTLPHVRGAVSAARADDPNSANSQFFIVFQPRLQLDKKYTVFGRVIDGMQFVDRIERGEPPANPTRIFHAYLGGENPPPFRAEAVPAPTAGLGAPVTLPGAAGAAVATAPEPAPARTPPKRRPAPRR